LDTVVTLPTLAGGTAKQQSTFLRYYNALKEHELGHYYYGKTAATEIDQKILQLPKMENCKALESTANKLGDDIIEFYKRKDSQYDVTTQHGKSQGAWLEE
jgi:predicted secreted Zn-dependent protease